MGIGYMAEEDEGAIGAEGAMGSEGIMGAKEDEEAAIHISLDGYDTMGIGYMALWVFWAKCVSGWSGVDGWMDGYPLDCYDY